MSKPFDTIMAASPERLRLMCAKTEGIKAEAYYPVHSDLSAAMNLLGRFASSAKAHFLIETSGISLEPIIRVEIVSRYVDCAAEVDWPDQSDWRPLCMAVMRAFLIGSLQLKQCRTKIPA